MHDQVIEAIAFTQLVGALHCGLLSAAENAFAFRNHLARIYLHDKNDLAPLSGTFFPRTGHLAAA